MTTTQPQRTRPTRPSPTTTDQKTDADKSAMRGLAARVSLGRVFAPVPSEFLLIAFYFHQQVMALEGFSSSVDIREISRRERDMLWWTAEGKTTKEIALILGLSDRTVRFYIENAMTKLRCHSKAQCVAKAIRIGAL